MPRIALSETEAQVVRLAELRRSAGVAHVRTTFAADVACVLAAYGVTDTFGARFDGDEAGDVVLVLPEDVAERWAVTDDGRAALAAEDVAA